MTMIAKSTLGPTKFSSPKISAHVRRKGWCQTYRTPSNSCERSDDTSRSRFAWNEARIMSRDIAENAYEMTSTTKGSTRAMVNSAPPSGEPASCTIACRPVWTAAASGS
jgi:hypothetical protein